MYIVPKLSIGFRIYMPFKVVFCRCIAHLCARDTPPPPQGGGGVTGLWNTFLHNNVSSLIILGDTGNDLYYENISIISEEQTIHNPCIQPIKLPLNYSIIIINFLFLISMYLSAFTRATRCMKLDFVLVSNRPCLSNFISFTAS